MRYYIFCFIIWVFIVACAFLNNFASIFFFAVCGEGKGEKDGSCVDCLAGTYSRADMSTCEDCPIGFYADGSAISNCTSCSNGYNTTSTGSISATNCTGELIDISYLVHAAIDYKNINYSLLFQFKHWWINNYWWSEFFSSLETIF